MPLRSRQREPECTAVFDVGNRVVPPRVCVDMCVAMSFPTESLSNRSEEGTRSRGTGMHGRSSPRPSPSSRIGHGRSSQRPTYLPSLLGSGRALLSLGSGNSMPSLGSRSAYGHSSSGSTPTGTGHGPSSSSRHVPSSSGHGSHHGPSQPRHYHQSRHC